MARSAALPATSHSMSATCHICGSKWSLSENDLEIIIAAYKEWDARHQHPEAKS